MPVAFLSLALVVGGCTRGESFPVAEFRKTPSSLEGNRYVLEAEVETQLKWQEGVGRFLAVSPLKDKNPPVPVFIADSLKANLSGGQRYRFDLVVKKGGLLYVNSLSKI